jgi:regulator of cell morphogenesis and NO signaling
MMIQQTVGEIAAERPAAVRVFEKYRIDFCCGGHRPLAEVCQEKGISPDTLLDEVEHAGRNNGPAETDWASAGLRELIGHIVDTHHAFLKAELPAIGARLEKVAAAHGEKYPEVVRPLRDVFADLDAELEAHMRKEELVLFPAIEELETAQAEGRPAMPPPFGTVRNPIRMMIYEHDHAGNALEEMRRLTGGYTLPPDACNTWRALYYELEQVERDLHVHIHLENNVLFPRAAQLESELS